ncbi:MAG TPA: PLP-dependent aminotransferase family protein [Steroidobacteraceae bacterium]|nr:PLP-dependent aminotransferase family protein [Steroidobacteraceae bacterium]
MYLTLDKKGTLYEQIARALKLEILEGRIAPGTKLPATRTLATALGVARKSVLQAYELLCAEELAIARGGSGTRVAKVSPASRAPARARVVPLSRYATRVCSLPPITLAGAHVTDRPRYNLVYGEPLIDAALFHSWRRKLSAAALRAGPTYPAAGGYLPLRRAIADYLARRRGVLCNAADILIVAGTQQALSLVARVVVDPDDSVIVEDPHYQLAMHSLLAHGAHVRSARTDEQGLVVEELPQRSTRLIFVTPSHQFPSGVAMTLSRRLELLKWAAKSGSWIFEDDYDTEFHAGDRPLPALRSLDLADRVLYVGSFSKTLFPSLRLGYIVCPAALRDALYKAKLLEDLGSPSVEQAALATFIQSRQYEKHLRKSVKELMNRRKAVVDALQRLAGEHIEIGPHRAGMHFAIWFKQMSFDRLDAFITRAKSLGLGLHPIHPYYRVRPPRPGLLIGYAGLTVNQLKTAVELFVRCLAEE